MTVVNRTATLDASVEEVWAYFSQPENWPEWDPDNVAVAEDSEPGIVAGRMWQIEMKNPKKGQLTFRDVVEHESFSWSVVALGGAVSGDATFGFQTAEDGKTLFSYDFAMSGFLGRLLWRFGRNIVLKGVDGGLSNIIDNVR